MKKLFPGYYRPSEKEFAELWKTCLFAFDANVLLNLYRYTPETKTSLLAILEKVSDRIWLPHQPAFEYHNKRLPVIQQQMNAYDGVLEAVRKSRDELKGRLNSFARHPSIQIPEIMGTFNEALEKFEETLTRLKKEHPDIREDDPIMEAITRLFDGKVGGPTLETERVKIFKEGEDRYKLKRPPGYEDHRKGAAAQYADLVMWFQLIDKAKESKSPIIFVTDDRKEDWWLRTAEGRTVGPRPELVQEFFEKTSMAFYMYSADPFMEYATKYLEQKVERKAIDEVREIRRRDERSDRARRTLMDSSAYSAIEAARKEYEEMDRARRTLMDSSAYSAFEAARKEYEEMERARRTLMDSSAYSAFDGTFKSK